MSPQIDQKSFIKFQAHISKWKLMYLAASVGFPTLSQPFAGDTSLCVPSQCASVFLIPQCSLGTLNAAHLLSSEVGTAAAYNQCMCPCSFRKHHENYT